MDKVKTIALAVFKSPKVRLAAKALAIAVAGVIAAEFGFNIDLGNLI
jgi:hypothetical protein